MKNQIQLALVFAAAFTVSTFAQAQQATSYSLEKAVSSAIQNGSEMANARTTLEQSKRDLESREADPVSAVNEKLVARQAFKLAQVRLVSTQLEVMQNVNADYMALYEAQENATVVAAQLALDTRSLEITKARNEAGSATKLDISKAENQLKASKQSAQDLKAKMPVIASRLARLLGLPKGANIAVQAPKTGKIKPLDLNKLEANLDDRSPTLLEAAQAVELALLNLKLSDNDWTPVVQLRQAQTSLANAQRNFDGAQRGATTQLRDAFRANDDALEQAQIATQTRENAERTLTQDKSRLAGGTISKLEFLNSEIATVRARFQAIQANDGQLISLAALSVASGMDLLELGGAQ
jgi:outer membrane protein